MSVFSAGFSLRPPPKLSREAMADDSFKAFVLDQLAALPELHARAMFGAHGLYSSEHFFGILDDGRLYFRTDEASRVAYETRGMKPFTYKAKGRIITMGYHEVPLDILENAAELTAWADLAVAVAKLRKPGGR